MSGENDNGHSRGNVSHHGDNAIDCRLYLLGEGGIMKLVFEHKQWKELVESMTEEYLHLPVQWAISLWLSRN